MWYVGIVANILRKYKYEGDSIKTNGILNSTNCLKIIIFVFTKYLSNVKNKIFIWIDILKKKCSDPNEVMIYKEGNVQE
jgi:hypothetical protein